MTTTSLLLVKQIPNKSSSAPLVHRHQRVVPRSDRPWAISQSLVVHSGPRTAWSSKIKYCPRKKTKKSPKNEVRLFGMMNCFSTTSTTSPRGTRRYPTSLDQLLISSSSKFGLWQPPPSSPSQDQRQKAAAQYQDYHCTTVEQCSHVSSLRSRH